MSPLLPDPEPREARLLVVSVDDHLVEPPDLFAGRLPGKLADRGPRVVEVEGGRQMWRVEDQLIPNVGLNAVIGRPRDEWTFEPARFEDMRPAAYDINARVHDMDLAGIAASLCFPSMVTGFAGAVFARAADPELGVACVRAWNDWHHEVWAGTFPGRMIPLQIPWLADPVVAAEEVRRNAARGFRAVSFAENPAHMGLPSMHTDHWDPFLRECEETETVVCLHTGSSQWTAAQSPGAPIQLGASLFMVNAIASAADWLWAAIPLRFPRLRIALSEGGIGWVPMLLDRLDYMQEHAAATRFDSGKPGLHELWEHTDASPSELLRGHFWFCMIDDPSGLVLRERIGVDHIMLECDYPHSDSTWPDTQLVAQRRLAGLPDHEVQMITYQNACELFRFPVPPRPVASVAG